jgi:F0F1-type ATP synthase assembly protein I
MTGKSEGGSGGTPPSPRDPGRRPQGVSGAEFAGIGVQFAMVILVFTWGGVWLDGRLGTSPIFTILMVFMGAGGGFYSIYRKATASQRRDREGR